ncbi:MAG: TolB family protein [Solirubrobacteraceae bacterium]
MHEITERLPARTGRRRAAAATASLLLGALVVAVPAPAAFPGANGRIAFQGYRSLGTINAVGGDRRPLTSENAFFASPASSPDGRRLAFTSDRDGNSEVYVTGAEGGSITRLTTNAADDGAPAWSPDGSRIAFASDRANTWWFNPSNRSAVLRVT